jgi:hypothetical protein
VLSRESPPPLRDIAAVLIEMGETPLARSVQGIAIDRLIAAIRFYELESPST